MPADLDVLQSVRAEEPTAHRRWRVAYLVSHPIQYQAPLLRLIAAQPDIDLTVFFQTEGALHGHLDAGFGRVVTWDVPLLDGYRHEFLPAWGRRDLITPLRPFSHGIVGPLRRGGYDVLWAHGYARWFNWVAILAAKSAGLKVFVRDEATERSAPRSPLRRMAKRVFFSILAGATDAFLAIGTANRNYYLANGISGGRIFLCPYAVDNEFFRSRAAAAATRREGLRDELRLEPGRPIILYASKFTARKRPDDLLYAYERTVGALAGRPQPYLLYVGDGERRAALEAEARAKRLDGVRFLGFRNQSELPAFFDLCDVFVLPSVHEPWGLVVNEAMTAARAVIVSDQVGCAPDLVHHGVNGLVYPAGDVAALSDALHEVLAERGRARAMGAASLGIIDRWSFAEDLAGLRQALATCCPP